MKNSSLIVLVFLSLLSLGQVVNGFSLDQPQSEEGQIQPVDSSHDEETYPSASAFLIDAESRPESLLLDSYRLNAGFSESSEEEDNQRKWSSESQSKRKKNVWLFKAEIIERSLTFRELIFPHHFYF